MVIKINSLGIKDLTDVLMVTGATAYGVGAIIEAKKFKKMDKNKDECFMAGALYGQGLSLISLGVDIAIGLIAKNLRK